MPSQPGKSTQLRHGLAMALVMLVWGATSSLSHAADVFRGNRLYALHCISCHGGQGVSAAPGSPSFERGQGLLRPDFTLMEITRVGKNAMPGYQAILANRDILDIIAYMRTMR
jgi:cytochrome c6